MPIGDVKKTERLLDAAKRDFNEMKALFVSKKWPERVAKELRYGLENLAEHLNAAKEDYLRARGKRD